MHTQYINELSNLTSSHKIIPFLGAGSSINHLISWDELSNKLRAELEEESLNISNLEIAQKYVDIKGHKCFVEFLDKFLKVEKYDENLDILPLIIASLGIGLIYTTNQDNVFEKCIEQYGKKYKVVKTLDDLSTYLPGENLYIKYHGDTTLPDSLIFTKDSYDIRMNNKNHFLNIKMRADLLTKSFLFIGYSFRDPNIKLLFEEINSVFDNNLPKSYLIAYHYTKELEELNKLFGIIIIDPLKELPHCNNEQEAFEQYLSLLTEETLIKKSNSELDIIFKPDIPSTRKVVNKYELLSIERLLKNDDTISALNLFRVVMDTSLIPKSYQERTKNIFLEICKGLINPNDIQNLVGALFNLTSLEFKHSIDALAGVLTRAIYIEQTNGINIFKPTIRTLKESIYPIATARAIEYIKEWDLNVNDNFRHQSQNWLEKYSDLPDEIKEYVSSYISWAWKEHTIYENPIERALRLNNNSFKSKSYEQIHHDLTSLFPQKIFKPYEEVII